MNAIPQTSPLHFRKMQGCGNDFVVLDARTQPLSVAGAPARALADRRFGIGCDSVIVMEKTDGADLRMRVINADGSEAENCGNAARCVARLAAAEAGKSRIRIRVVQGLLDCAVNADGSVSVDMGAPRLDWQEIPLAERMDTRRLDIKVGPIDAPVLHTPAAVSMGNPHCVFFVEDVTAHAIDRIGPMIEHHPLFPERTNVEFAQILSRTHIRLRVWERGVGITMACGTGACATLVAAQRRGLVERRATITLDGGDLEIEWREADSHVIMTGPASESFHGIVDADLARLMQGAAP